MVFRCRNAIKVDSAVNSRTQSDSKMTHYLLASVEAQNLNIKGSGRRREVEGELSEEKESIQRRLR